MEAMTQALQQAGYTVESTEPYGENVAVGIIKDGIRQYFEVSPNLEADGIAAMVEWIELKHEMKQAERLAAGQ